MSSLIKRAQEAEVGTRVLGRDGGHGHVHMAADDLGDGADGPTLLTDAVRHRSRRCLLHRQTEQAREIEPVYRGPAVGPVAEVAETPFSRAL